MAFGFFKKTPYEMSTINDTRFVCSAFVNYRASHWLDNQKSKTKGSDVKDTFQLFGQFLGTSSSPKRLFLRKNTNTWWRLNEEDGCLSEYKEGQLDLSLIGIVTEATDHSIIIDSGKEFKINPALAWQIETLFSGCYLLISTENRIYVGRKIDRGAFDNDPFVKQAEEEHIRGKYGYSNPAIRPQRKDIWEDDERVYSQKPRKR